VHHDGNRGYGVALRSGFAAAEYDWVFFSDGDGQFDLGEIDGFLAAADRVDVVVGYRIDRADHAGRRLNTWLWGRLVRLGFRIPVRDIDCAFKLCSREVLDAVGPLNSTGAMISTELLARIRHAGFPLVEIGVHHYPRLGGEPTGANLRVIVRAFRELVVLRVRMWRTPRDAAAPRAPS
jgi:glycosyltransferase involved in cell wall biosynthesis